LLVFNTGTGTVYKETLLIPKTLLIPVKTTGKLPFSLKTARHRMLDNIRPADVLRRRTGLF
jgi:hypothetical protein